jgi:hypothetical protein
VAASLGEITQPVIRISSYNIPTEQQAETQLIFAMPFGKADVTNIAGDTPVLKNAEDMACTEYPLHLSLTELNNQRLETF